MGYLFGSFKWVASAFHDLATLHEKNYMTDLLPLFWPPNLESARVSRMTMNK